MIMSGLTWGSPLLVLVSQQIIRPSRPPVANIPKIMNFNLNSKAEFLAKEREMVYQNVQFHITTLHYTEFKPEAIFHGFTSCALQLIG